MRFAGVLLRPQVAESPALATSPPRNLATIRPVGMHLGDEVEIVTDSFASVGAPLGAIGVIVDDWADGSNDVEVSDPESGEMIARFRAAEGEIIPHPRTVLAKEHREHGFLFGRGDDLGAPPGDPPAATPKQFAGMPGSSNGAWYGNELPPEDAKLTGDIPWELREEPPTGPIFN